MQSITKRRGLIALTLLAFVWLTVAVMPGLTGPATHTAGSHPSRATADTNFISPSGVYLKRIMYHVGDEVRLSTIVSNLPRNPDLTPIGPKSAQLFFDHAGGQVHAWYDLTNGYNLIIDLETANQSSVGTHTAYTQVTLFDDSVITSEPAIMVVIAPPAGDQ